MSYLVQMVEKLIVEAVLPGPDDEGGKVRDCAFGEDEHCGHPSALTLVPAAMVDSGLPYAHAAGDASDREGSSTGIGKRLRETY